MTVTDDRRGLDALQRRLGQLRRVETRVGVLKPDPTDDGVSIATIAAAHELGARIVVNRRTKRGKGGSRRKRRKKRKGAGDTVINIPQRSFIASTIDGEAAQIEQVQAKALDGVISGRLTADQAADLVGLDAASRIRETIRSNVGPALKPATVRRKGDSRTLVDKSQLLNSVKHEVVQKGSAA